MKKIILLSAFYVFGAQAQMTVTPIINNFGYNAQVMVNNLNDFSVRCSGPIIMNFVDGRSEVQYFYETILARGLRYRTFFPYNRSTRINFVTNSIFCRKG